MSLIARKVHPQTEQTKRVNNITGNVGVPSLQIINGKLIAYQDNQEQYIVKGYNFNDIVYSIVRMITDKARVAPWGVYTVADEQSYKLMKSEQGKKDISFSKAKDLFYKALKPVANPGKWGELLKYPNETETYSDYVAAGIAFKLLTGNKYKVASLLGAGANAGTPNSLFLLPSQYTNIIASNTFPAKALGYEMTLIPNVQFKANEVCHEKYFNPNYDVNGNQLYGMAPLKAGLMRLQKSNSLMRAEASSFQNEGIKGVLAMKNNIGQVDGEVAQQEVANLAATMRTEWRGEKNRGRIGLSGYALDWIPIGLSSEEMQMIESGLMDLRMLCNIFGGVPTQLLNDPVNKTYNTFKEAEKSLTSRCVLPELVSERDSMNRKASTDWGLPKGQVIDFDMTVFGELANDAKEVASWTDTLIAISPNEQRELCGLAALSDPELSKPWVKTLGRVPIDEFQMTMTDNALNDGENIQ